MSLTAPYTGNTELDTFLYNLTDSLSTETTVTSNANTDPTNGSPVGYLKRYIQIKYADNNVGGGFSNSPTNKSYYGIYNSDSLTESTNPADYTWYLTAGFNNNYKLWYSIIGGRQIKFVVSILTPGTKWLFEPGTSIDLDNVTVDSSNLQPDVLEVGKLLNILENSITEDQLFTDLGNRINLIDGSSSLTNSVNARILSEANARTTAINAEASTRAQAILDEAAARSSADGALQTQINLLSAAGSGDFSELLAAVQEEQTARIAGDTAEATARETLATQMRGSYTGTDPSQLTTGIVYNERQSRITSEGVINSNISSLQSTVSTNLTNTNAAITTEATTRANADTALSSSISTLTSTVNTNLTNTNAAITNEANTRASADTALSSSINSLSSTVTNNYNTLNSAITTEQNTRASADSTISSNVTTLQSSFGSNTLVYNSSFANNSTLGWTGVNSATSTPPTGMPKSNAGIQVTRDAFFPDADASAWYSCVPGDEFELGAWVASTSSNPKYTIGIQYQKETGETNTWTGVATTGVGGPVSATRLHGYWTAPSDAKRVRFWSQINTFGTEEPWYITDVMMRKTDTRTGQNTVAIQTEASTRATETGNLFAQYTVKIDNNGYVSGFGLASTAGNATPYSDFIFRADRFAIASPSGPGITPTVPFITYTTPTTVNGITVQPGVYMKNAAIEYVKADQIDTRGLTIKDSAGTTIFSSGVPLESNRVTADPSWLNKNASFAPYYHWDFTNSVEGWESIYATTTASNSIARITATTGDPIFITPTISLNGNINRIIRIRIKRISGSAWDGGIFYATASHGETEAYKNYMTQPVWDGNYQIIEVDMTNLAVGGSDWIDNTITRIRFDFGASPADVFDIDWISVGRYTSASKIDSNNASTFIADAAIGSAQVGQLTASNINVDTLSAISANMGTITAGTIRLPATGNSYLIIDGANNRIDVYEAGVLRVRLGNLA